MNLLVTINNQTPKRPYLTIDVIEGSNEGYFWSGGSTLPPYGPTIQHSSYLAGLETTVTLKDAGGNQVAAFTLHMHYRFAEGGRRVG